MKTLLKTFFIFLLFCSASTQAGESLCEENDSFKLYVNSQDLLIDDNALLLIDGGEVIQVKSIAVDSLGIYVVMARDSIRARECGNGHPEYHGCGGCANWWCPFRCKCYSPWAVINNLE